MEARKQSEAVEMLHAAVEAAYRSAGTTLKDVPLDELEKRCAGHEVGKSVTGWKNPYPAHDPRSLLLEYQFAYARDGSRFKSALQARQTGKDFSSECEAAEDCHARPGTEWMIAAPSERQALDSLDQGKVWAEAFDLVIADYQERREGSSQTLLKSAEIIFSNKSRMRAVPGKPDTVRGRSANLLLTEVDFFENPRATWRAILPSITNPLRGGQKRVRLVSTPNGRDGLMYKVRSENTRKMQWSHHLVTIYHAVLMGLPVDIEELREAFGDPDGWAQEFCCQFLDTAAVLLTYELIAGCESVEATEVVPGDYWTRPGQFIYPVDLGIDFGRKKDLTVCWAAEKIADLQITKEVLCLEKMSTPKQVEILSPRIQKARRVCLDYTGPGIGLGDYLVKEFGEWNPDQHKYGKVELITFTNAMKVELFTKLRMAYERRAWRIPINVAIREDLHSVYRVVTESGNLTYKAPSNDDGHADKATANALCTRAGEWNGVCGRILVPRGRRANVMRDRKNRVIFG